MSKLDRSLILKKATTHRRRRFVKSKPTAQEEWLIVDESTYISDRTASNILFELCKMLGIKVEINTVTEKIRMSQHLTEEQEQILLGDDNA